MHKRPSANRPLPKSEHGGTGAPDTATPVGSATTSQRSSVGRVSQRSQRGGFSGVHEGRGSASAAEGGVHYVQGSPQLRSIRLHQTADVPILDRAAACLFNHFADGPLHGRGNATRSGQELVAQLVEAGACSRAVPCG